MGLTIDINLGGPARARSRDDWSPEARAAAAKARAAHTAANTSPTKGSTDYHKIYGDYHRIHATYTPKGESAKKGATFSVHSEYGGYKEHAEKKLRGSLEKAGHTVHSVEHKEYVPEEKREDPSKGKKEPLSLQAQRVKRYLSRSNTVGRLSR